MSRVSSGQLAGCCSAMLGVVVVGVLPTLLARCGQPGQRRAGEYDARSHPTKREPTETYAERQTLALPE